MFNVIQTDQGPDLEWVGLSDRPRSIMLGSGKGGCGKTASTVQTAAALAVRGADVLIAEISEGHGPLTHRFAPREFHNGHGTGRALQRIVGAARPGATYFEARTQFLPEARIEAEGLFTTIKRVQVDPQNPKACFEFMPCAETHLATVAANPRMQERPTRRALFAATIDALVERRGKPWDFILFDVLPNVDSLVLKGALATCDAFALLVDMQSADPLPGFPALREEIQSIEREKGRTGQAPEPLFKGLIYNRIATGRGKRPPLTERINRLEIDRLMRKANRTFGILAEIREMASLQMVTYNMTAVEELARAYGGTIPPNPEELSDRDLEQLEFFTEGMDEGTNPLTLTAGPRYLGKFMPSAKKSLLAEERAMLGLILGLSGDARAFDDYQTAVENYYRSIARSDEEEGGSGE